MGNRRRKVPSPCCLSQPFPAWTHAADATCPRVHIDMTKLDFTVRQARGILAPPPTKLQVVELVPDVRKGWKSRDAGEWGWLRFVSPESLDLGASSANGLRGSGQVGYMTERVETSGKAVAFKDRRATLRSGNDVMPQRGDLRLPSGDSVRLGRQGATALAVLAREAQDMPDSAGDGRSAEHVISQGTEHLRRVADRRSQAKKRSVRRAPSSLKTPTKSMRSRYGTPEASVSAYPVLRKLPRRQTTRPLPSSPLAAGSVLQTSSSVSPDGSGPESCHDGPPSPFPLDPRLKDQTTIERLAEMAREHGARYRARHAQSAGTE